MVLLSYYSIVLNGRPSSHHIGWLLPSHPHPSQREGEKREGEIKLLPFKVTAGGCIISMHSLLVRS